MGGSTENGFERIATVNLLGPENPNISTGQAKDYHAKHLAMVIRQLGWDGPKPIRIKGKAKRGYERPVQTDKGGA